jgi:hypothetical protein
VQNPWLFDLDALVTPPGVRAPGDRSARGVVVDLLRHRVRAGTGVDWIGHTGHIEVGPEQLVVRDFESVSAAGRIAVGGSFERAGRRAGDLDGKVDITGLALDSFGMGYHGKLETHAAVTRSRGVWKAELAVDATGVSMDPRPDPPGLFAVLPALLARNQAGPPAGSAVIKPLARAAAPLVAATAARAPPPAATATAPKAAAAAPPATSDPTTAAPLPAQLVVDTHVRAKLENSQVAVTVDAESRGLGNAKLVLALDAPREISDAAAWKRLGRSAIRTGELTLQGIQIGRAAQLAGAPGAYTGKIEGTMKLSADAVGGRVAATNIVVPRLRGMTGVNVVVDLSQTGPTELTPSVTATIAGIGSITAQAQVTMPDKLFDPAAWAALGPRMLHGARVRAENVNIDPAMLDRFGMVSDLRGKLSLSVDVGEGASTMQAAVDVVGLRGKPFLQPIDLRLAAVTGDRETTTTLSVASNKVTLLDLQARLPGSLVEVMQQMRTDPRGAEAIKLAATAKLASVDAPKLLAVFGRSEIIAGKIDGDFELGGTFGTPTAKLNLVATGLKVPPGPGGKPVKTVDRIAVVGSWDGRAAKLDVDGTEASGGVLKLTAAVNPSSLGDGTVTLKATKLDLIPILAFLPGPAGGASGQLDANLTIKSLDLRTMKLAGEAHLIGARIPIAPTVGTLRAAKVDAVISDREIKLNVDGKLGGGTVVVAGSIALEGASPNGGKAKLTLRKVSPIGAVEPTISADVTADLSHQDNQWHANLVVDNAFVVVPHDRGEKLKPPGMPSDMRFATGKRTTRRPLDQREPVDPIFVVTITLNSTRVESDEFRGLIKGKLECRADGEAFGVFGGIDADRGDLDLFGRRYYVERAGVHFDGALDPLLDVRITHDFSDITTVTEVHGRVSKPELTLSSDPGTYTQSQLLGFLLGGDPAGEGQSGAGADRVADAGASIVANKLGGYVRDALPIDIDVLRYEAATAATSAAVTVGTWITHSLFVAYRQHLESRADENTGEGEVEYWLSRRVMIEGTAGNNGYNGVDLLWRKRY